jgi:hypothetical protein
MPRYSSAVHGAGNRRSVTCRTMVGNCDTPLSRSADPPPCEPQCQVLCAADAITRTHLPAAAFDGFFRCDRHVAPGHWRLFQSFMIRKSRTTATGSSLSPPSGLSGLPSRRSIEAWFPRLGWIFGDSKAEALTRRRALLQLRRGRRCYKRQPLVPNLDIPQRPCALLDCAQARPPRRHAPEGERQKARSLGRRACCNQRVFVDQATIGDNSVGF